jgi:hypothetical protein
MHPTSLYTSKTSQPYHRNPQKTTTKATNSPSSPSPGSPPPPRDPSPCPPRPSPRPQKRELSLHELTPRPTGLEIDAWFGNAPGRWGWVVLQEGWTARWGAGRVGVWAVGTGLNGGAWFGNGR